MNPFASFPKVWHKIANLVKYKINRHKKLRVMHRIMRDYDTSKHYVFIEFYDACRLGNQMFFVSFGENLKNKYGWEVRYWTRISNFVDYVEPFIYDRFDLVIKDRIDCEMHIEENWNWNSSPDLVESALLKGNVLISGAFEDLNLHDNDLYKKLFKCPLEIKEKINRYYGDLNDYISVHVRRGDFVYLGIALGADYYKRAVDILLSVCAQDKRSAKIVIISDDIHWCKENLAMLFPGRIEFADKHPKDSDSILVDLYIPSLCSIGNVISCSTFCFWGAALNQNLSAICVEPYPWWNGKSKLYLEKAIKLDTKSLCIEEISSSRKESRTFITDEVL